MIDEKLLLYFIKTKKEEFEEQSFTIYKECTGSLRDMEYDDVIIHSVNLLSSRLYFIIRGWAKSVTTLLLLKMVNSMLLIIQFVMVGNVKNNNFNLYEQVYISLSRTVSNFECINEELKQETITEALKKSQVINEYVKYQGKLLPFHMFVFEVKKNLLSKNLERG